MRVSNPDSYGGITAQPTGGAARIARVVDDAMLSVARHWLAIVNSLVAIFAGLPLLAPFLLAAGYEGAGRLIFVLYRTVCHQKPMRSFFLWGEQMAYCQRNTAIYTSILAGGLVFALVRHRFRGLRLRPYLLLIAPMALDGFTQLSGLRESNWILRVITGTLFGLATVWLVYPILERGFKTIGDSVQRSREQRGELPAT